LAVYDDKWIFLLDYCHILVKSLAVAARITANVDHQFKLISDLILTNTKILKLGPQRFGLVSMEGHLQLSHCCEILKNKVPQMLINTKNTITA
jgi:hypothetical protein